MILWQDVSTDCTDEAGKVKQNDNPFIEPVQTQTVVDMKDVMVLNDIIEQAAGRQSHASDHGGNFFFYNFFKIFFNFFFG